MRPGKGIFLRCLAHLTVAHMGVNLGGVELLVPQNLLERPHVHAAFRKHQGGRRVAQLVRRVPLLVELRILEIFFHHELNRPAIDAPLLPAEKNRIAMLALDPLGRPHRKIGLQRRNTGVVEVNLALLVALSDNAHHALPEVEP